MSARPKKKKSNEKQSGSFIYPRELVKGMKPGEVKQIGDSIYIIPVFVCDPPEPIKRTGKARSPKSKK
jgi:hypothetical protein